MAEGMGGPQMQAGSRMRVDCGHGQRALQEDSHCKCIVIVIKATVGATERDG